MRKYIFLCAAISSKNGGLNGWAFTDVFLKKIKINKIMINRLYKPEHNETQQKQKISQSPSKK
jgi:hypothetical protein